MVISSTFEKHDLITTLKFCISVYNLQNRALAFILPSLCYKKACSEQLGKWDVRMWKLIFFTGVGALMLGVVQNLPKAEVIEIEYPTDYIEPIDKQKIDELTENMRNKLDTDLIGNWLIILFRGNIYSEFTINLRF